MRERLGDKALRCVGYGHVGDSNLHLVSFHFRDEIVISLSECDYGRIQRRSEQPDRAVYIRVGCVQKGFNQC